MDLNARNGTAEYKAALNELGDKAALIYKNYEELLREIRGNEAATQFRNLCEEAGGYKKHFLEECKMGGLSLYEMAAIVGSLNDSFMGEIIKADGIPFKIEDPFRQLGALMTFCAVAYDNNFASSKDPDKALAMTIGNAGTPEKPRKWADLARAIHNSLRIPHT